MIGLLPLLATATAAPSLLNVADAPIQLSPHFELGFVGPVSHTIQFGQDGTKFDYVEEGGQDNLFPFLRLQMDVGLGEKHHLSFLYQPLNIETRFHARRDVQINDNVFPEGTPMETRYGFDFYRLSWSREVGSSESNTWRLGLAMQIRNATIDFWSIDGEVIDTERDIGPVPLFLAAGEFRIDEHSWWGIEATGAYAPVSYLNGDNNEVLGALLDASLRYGIHAQNGMDPFINLRYLGGGAEGITDDPDPGKDGYTQNWIHTVGLTLGLKLR